MRSPGLLWVRLDVEAAGGRSLFMQSGEAEAAFDGMEHLCLLALPPGWVNQRVPCVVISINHPLAQ